MSIDQINHELDTDYNTLRRPLNQLISLGDQVIVNRTTVKVNGEVQEKLVLEYIGKNRFKVLKATKRKLN